MNKYSREVLEFARQWEPFGGGDDFVFLQFGVEPEVFYRRLRRLLKRELERPDVPADFARLERHCSEKIAQYMQHRQVVREPYPPSMEAADR